MFTNLLPNLGRPELYTLAWVSVLKVDRTAATALLSEQHEQPSGFKQHRLDDNSYTWGCMGKHNVVIISLGAGGSGTSLAALTAQSISFSLPHIQAALLVGVGGGIPNSRRDIRLGDVAVSQPNNGNGGVVQYDFVKVEQGSQRKSKDVLGKPPRMFLKAIPALQVRQDLHGSNIPMILDEMIAMNPQLAAPTEERAGFKFPGHQKDMLFEDDCGHSGGADCRMCDKSKLVPAQRPRTANHPKIHYGTIASGNSVVKDSVSRKQLIEHLSLECICYEMEAAGVMAAMPCLVIRGISNYADSHKNDEWQPYAAATAAAFARELLDFVPVYAPDKVERATEVILVMPTIARKSI